MSGTGRFLVRIVGSGIKAGARRSEPTEADWAEVASADPTNAPYMDIDDSAAKDAPRRVAVGRKSHLHPGKDRFGRPAAVPIGLVQSGRGPGNSPRADLHDFLNRVSMHPPSRVSDPSPDRRVLNESEPPAIEADRISVLGGSDRDGLPVDPGGRTRRPCSFRDGVSARAGLPHDGRGRGPRAKVERHPSGP